GKAEGWGAAWLSFPIENSACDLTVAATQMNTPGLRIPPNNRRAGAFKLCATAMTFRSTFLWSLALGAVAAGAALAAPLPDKVDFNHHIKPLLSDRCFPCHGPDEKARKAKL